METWQEQMYFLSDAKRFAPALDLLFEHVDQWLWDGHPNHPDLEQQLNSIDLSRINNTTMLIGLLCITNPMRNNSIWLALAEKIGVAVTALDPDRADKLLYRWRP